MMKYSFLIYLHFTCMVTLDFNNLVRSIELIRKLKHLYSKNIPNLDYSTISTGNGRLL